MYLFLAGLTVMAALFFFKAYNEFTGNVAKGSEASSSLAMVFIGGGILSLAGAGFVLYRILTM